MKKSIIFAFFAALLITVVSLTGCNVVSSLSTDTSSAIPEILSSKASISASISKSGTSYTLTIGTVAVTNEAGTYEAVASLPADKFKIFKVKSGYYSGTGTEPLGFPSGLDAATAVVIGASVTDVTMPGIDTTQPLDVCFILDTTGSMGSMLTTAKNSISDYASYLETQVSDVKFAIQTYGDVSCEARTPAVGDATLKTSVQAKAFLDALPSAGSGPGGSGGDDPENPIEATIYANTYMPWRSGAQRMFVIITDASAHTLNDGDTNVYDLGGTSRACGANLASAEALLESNSVTTIVNAAGPALVSPPYENIRDLCVLVGGLGIDFDYSFSASDLISLAAIGSSTYKSVDLGDLTDYDYILIYVASGSLGYDSFKVIPLATVIGASSATQSNN